MRDFRIQSDHNEDNSEEIINEWLSEWEQAYHSVHVDLQPSPPYHIRGESGPAHWPDTRFSHIIDLREKALYFSKSVWADYIWVLYIFVVDYMV